MPVIPAFGRQSSVPDWTVNDTLSQNNNKISKCFKPLRQEVKKKIIIIVFGDVCGVQWFKLPFEAWSHHVALASLVLAM